MPQLTIGDLADQSGVNSKLIRHYESIDLIKKADRSEGGYRLYAQSDVRTLRFIKRARSLGFSLEETKKLLGLWQDQKRASRDVKKIAQLHIRELEAKAREIQIMIQSLRTMTECCHGDTGSQCSILEGIEGMQ